MKLVKKYQLREGGKSGVEHTVLQADCRERLRSTPLIQAAALHNKMVQEAKKNNQRLNWTYEREVWGENTTNKLIRGAMQALDPNHFPGADRRNRANTPSNTWLNSPPVHGRARARAHSRLALTNGVCPRRRAVVFRTRVSASNGTISCSNRTAATSKPQHIRLS